jgi:ATP-binding cassette subfamily B protein
MMFQRRGIGLSGRARAVVSESSGDRDEHLARHPLRSAWRDLRPYRKRIALAACFVILAALARMAVPQAVRIGIDRGAMGDQRSIQQLVLAFALGIGSLTAMYVFSRLQISEVARLGERFLFDLRRRVFSHIQSLHIDFFDKELTGRLVARMTSDIESLQAFVIQGLIVVVSSVLAFVLSLAVLLQMSWQLTLASMSVLPPLLVATVVFRRRANPAYLTVRERVSQVMARLQENLTGMRVVQAFAREEQDADKFEGLNEAQFQAQLDTARLQSFYFPAVEFLGMAAVAIVLGYGSYLAAGGVIGFGVVAAFLFYLSNIFEPVQQVSMLYNELQAASAALQKLYGILEIEPRVRDRPDAGALVVSKGSISFEGVGFAYEPGKPALSGVDLEIPAGARVAVVGKTGAGKSTLVKLAARFYDPDSGRVCIDGQDLSCVTLRSIRDQVVFVPQEGFVFSGSVWQNIAMDWDPAARDGAIAAAEDIGVADIFEALPQGFDTELTGQGQILSAGQRQLIGLARAYMAKPRVMLLDEAASAVDAQTAAVIENAMSRLLTGRTSVTIAHRLSTAAASDLVVVMSEGRVVEFGSHEELVRREGHYAALWASWTRSTAGRREL